MTRILLTGAAGFIGSHLVRSLLRDGAEVHGVDNLGAYCDAGLKEARLALLRPEPGFTFDRVDITDAAALAAVFARARPDLVIHLAARVGVRDSVTHPREHLDTNVTGFFNVLEGCVAGGARHLLYASSSSVYGNGDRVSLGAIPRVDRPVSFYAATKVANELMAHAFATIHGLPVTGLRFFTVYGPWGRPDMAPMLFADAILSGRPIRVFDHGRQKRDFTYVGDVVEAAARLVNLPAPGREEPGASGEPAPYRILDVGSGRATALLDFIEILERCLGRTAEKLLLPAEPGDVRETRADPEEIRRLTGAAFDTPLEGGLNSMAEWFREYRRGGLGRG